MIAETSRVARHQVEESGGISAGCRRVMLFLHREPEQAFTRAEIARGSGMPLQTVCARVRDLLDDELPRIEELAPRACKVTGNPSKPIRVAAPSTTPRRMADERSNPESRTQPAGQSLTSTERAAAEETKANRAGMPGVAACVDAFRRIFPDCKVTYASEGGRTLGSPSPQGVPFTPPGLKLKQRRAA